MPIPKVDEFIFSPRYRIQRHTLFWASWLLGWTCFWTMVGATVTVVFLRVALYIPVLIIYSYPVSHIAVPKLLFNGKYLTFFCFIIFWIVVGWYLNVYFVNYIFMSALKLLGIFHGAENTPLGFHCMVVTVACFSALSLSKHWVKKQQAWLQAEQEKVTAQLQLLKAQLHPHFLFNTLNNIYSFAVHNSPKTPEMVLKLSSLLGYVLYDCKAEEVLLSKEVSVMKDYIDLERERYGDKIDVSINIEGDIEDKYITPLIMLPFLENAFKHGTSEQLTNPWMSVDLAVKGNLLQCKIVNSKNENVPFHKNGVGIYNVQKRLELLYAGQFELKLSSETDFFVVSLLLNLQPATAPAFAEISKRTEPQIYQHEMALFAGR